jgi:hypothetical protein
MVMRGEAATAWPLLEDSLRESRQLGMRVGESQALGFLARKAYAEGDLARAIELALESASIAREVEWTWWEAGQLAFAATVERELGDLDAAEVHSVRSLELSLKLGDRQSIVYDTAELAIIASARGDAMRSGLLWGAIEMEVSSGRVGQWERERGEIEALVLLADGPVFSAARAEGSLLSIPQAVGLEVAPTG